MYFSNLKSFPVFSLGASASLSLAALLFMVRRSSVLPFLKINKIEAQIKQCFLLLMFTAMEEI